MPGDLSYTPPPDPLLGQVLAGRYMIQKKLGEGGMGAVYLATHRVLEKDVALKVLHGEFARKPDLVERFMQEAKSASRIRHENVIDISDFGTTPDGLVFFAMELLRGHDLHEEIARARLSGTRLPWARTKPIFLQICAALSAAHAQGIVHRDLKPENIYLVEWLGHRDFVKLLDFGIAKMTEVSEGDRKLTRTGMLFGTPEYMSPEQARGEHVDHRVDVYAMGCILYQLVTGRVPFEAENFMGILSLHLTEPPPPIAPVIFQEIGAPQGLAAVIDKALAKNRDQRFQRMDELANAIHQLHGEAEISAQYPAALPATTMKRTQWTGQVSLPTEDDVEAPRKPSGGSRVPMIAIAALLAIGVGVAAFVIAGGSGKKSGSTAPDPKQAVVIDAGAAAPQPPPAAAKVKLTIESDPTGADIFDLTTQKSIGPTPMEFEVDRSSEPRRYRLSAAGYVAKVIELVPSEDVPYAATLTKAKKGAPAPAEVVEVVPQKGRPTPSKTPAIGKDTVKDTVKTVKDTVKEPLKEPLKEPEKEPQKEPQKEPVKEPVKEPIKQPDPQPGQPEDGDDEPVIKNPFPVGSGSGSGS